MKTLVRWAARLYPAAWRARYGVEMEALLEDVGPRGGDLWDTVRGALNMQMTNLSFWKILAGCTLAGMLAAGIWSVALPERYVSTAVMRIDAAPGDARIQMMRLQQVALSRFSLLSIISGQNLYVKERKSRRRGHCPQLPLPRSLEGAGGDAGPGEPGLHGTPTRYRGFGPSQPAGDAGLPQSHEHRGVGNGGRNSAGPGGVAFPPAEARYGMK